MAYSIPTFSTAGNLNELGSFSDDVDSIIICAQDLKFYKCPAKFTIPLLEKNSKEMENKKLFKSIEEKYAERHGGETGGNAWYYDFLFGGESPRLYVCLRVPTEIPQNSLMHEVTKMRQIFLDIVRESVASLDDYCKTKVHGSHVMFVGTLSTCAIFREDWKKFATTLVRNLNVAGYFFEHNISAFFYTAEHGLLLPRDDLSEYLSQRFNIECLKNIYVGQLHLGRVTTPKYGKCLLFNLEKLGSVFFCPATSYYIYQSFFFCQVWLFFTHRGILSIQLDAIRTCLSISNPRHKKAGFQGLRYIHVNITEQ